jgi:hypothetical protein
VITALAYLTLAAFVVVFLAMLLALYKDTYGAKWPRRGK